MRVFVVFFTKFLDDYKARDSDWATAQLKGVFERKEDAFEFIFREKISFLEDQYAKGQFNNNPEIMKYIGEDKCIPEDADIVEQMWDLAVEGEFVQCTHEYDIQESTFTKASKRSKKEEN